LRKIAAILLLATLFFNWYGYRFVLALLQQKANVELEARLDNNDYDESSLIEIKVLLNLPYQTDRKDFERCDGEIVINGMYYKYVKRKVQDGMLILKCIPNATKHRIVSARDDFFKFANGLQQDNCSSKKQNAPNSTILKNLLSDFDGEQYFDIIFTNTGKILRHPFVSSHSFCFVVLPRSPEPKGN
jgi:hypothetical protein